MVIPQLAGLIGMILVSRSSDRKLERRYLRPFRQSSRSRAAVIGHGGFSSGFSGRIHRHFVGVGRRDLQLYCSFLLDAERVSHRTLRRLRYRVDQFGGERGRVRGPYVIGLLNQKTGELNGGMVFTGISLLVCATLALLLPKRRLAA